MGRFAIRGTRTFVMGVFFVCLFGFALAQNTVPVGVLVSQSPPGSVIQGTQVLAALEIARDMINEAGGVLGNPIELIVEDTSGQPEKGRSGIEKLILQNNVVAVTGEHQSSVCLAEIEVAHEHGVPFLNVNCWSDAVRELRYPEVFNPSPWNSLVAEGLATVITEMGSESVVALVENTDYGIGQAEILEATLAELAPDLSFRYQVLDRTSTDFTPVLLPLRRNAPDMVVPIMLPPGGYLLLNQLYEQGIAPSSDTWLFDGAGIADNPDFWDNISDAARTLLAFGFYHPGMELTEVGNEVRNRYVAEVGADPSRLVFQAADSLFAIAEAIELAGSTDHEAVMNALREVSFEGTRATVTFDLGADGGIFQQWLDIPYVVYQFEAPGQDLADTTLLLGPGVEFDESRLIQP